ncbi:DUF2489 domain-containing protein [Glaciecola petra]|uniref:DUF2489 domain-containing protein n=1 Tax=Glaciecola petra TaxID=3075602 RepID=A0ABU2ZRZ6_9ALTE|nr:DUF2489 domain-containing protein [Aestuariibacter sp. P117]MDT0594803.1 DUF2489 domain-containing protein [Aestuariibacter sp. P117]
MEAQSTSFDLLFVVLLFVGGLIIVGLGVYAGRLIYMVKNQNTQQRHVRNRRIESMQSSIQTIAFAMQQQQCDLSEGVIRICRLLESLPLDPLPDYREHFPSTHALFDKVKNYPTHEARNALSKKERRSQDKEREQFESEYESAILKETEQLRIFEALETKQ